MLALKDTDACFCLRMLTCRSMFVLCSFVSLFMYVFTFVPVRCKRAVEGKQLCVCVCVRVSSCCLSEHRGGGPAEDESSHWRLQVSH